MADLVDELVTYTDPNSPTAEAIRCLRTNILFLNPGKDIKIIGITSALPRDGKSFLSGNLAVATAQSNKKTAIIDCDLRRAGLSRLFNLHGKEGLSNALVNREFSVKDLPFYDVGIDNLSVLPSGSTPTNPAELLGLDAMATILSAMREKFDIAYIDLPPVLSVTDPMVISKRTDGVIFVVMANFTPKKAAIRAYSLLKDANINIMGSVLNKVGAGLGGYYKYRYKYGDYYAK